MIAAPESQKCHCDVGDGLVFVVAGRDVFESDVTETRAKSSERQ